MCVWGVGGGVDLATSPCLVVWNVAMIFTENQDIRKKESSVAFAGHTKLWHERHLNVDSSPFQSHLLKDCVPSDKV